MYSCFIVAGRSRLSKENGKSKLYSTRCATGSIKRRRYNAQFSSNDSSTDNSDTEDDTKTPQTVTTNNHIDDATSDSDTASESGDTTDVEVSSPPTRYNTRTAENSHRTVTDRHVALQTFHASASRSESHDNSQAVRTRNQGRRTVRYREDSDHEADHNSVTSDNDSIPGANVSVSSRGRIRRLTPRAQAAMLAD